MHVALAEDADDENKISVMSSNKVLPRQRKWLQSHKPVMNSQLFARVRKVGIIVVKQSRFKRHPRRGLFVCFPLSIDCQNDHSVFFDSIFLLTIRPPTSKQDKLLAYKGVERLFHVRNKVFICTATSTTFAFFAILSDVLCIAWNNYSSVILN